MGSPEVLGARGSFIRRTQAGHQRDGGLCQAGWGAQPASVEGVIRHVFREQLGVCQAGWAAESLVTQEGLEQAKLACDEACSQMKDGLLGSGDARLARIEREMQSIKSGLVKLQAQLKEEVDKFTSGRLLDLDLERHRVRQELEIRSKETRQLEARLDRELGTLRDQLIVAKADITNACTGLVLVACALGLATIRFLT